MQKMFLGIWFLMVSSQSCAVQGEVESGNTVTNLEAEPISDYAYVRPSGSYVFEGAHDKLPIGEHYEISIDTSEHKGVIPSTISQAFEMLSASLPAWYQNALLKGDRDRKCLVDVNNKNITISVAAWLEENWQLEKMDHPINREFQLLGYDYDERSLSMVVLFTFCIYLESNEKIAIDTYRCLKKAEKQNDESAAIECYKQ